MRSIVILFFVLAAHFSESTEVRHPSLIDRNAQDCKVFKARLLVHLATWNGTEVPAGTTGCQLLLEKESLAFSVKIRNFPNHSSVKLEYVRESRFFHSFSKGKLVIDSLSDGPLWEKSIRLVNSEKDSAVLLVIEDTFLVRVVGNEYDSLIEIEAALEKLRPGLLTPLRQDDRQDS